MSPSTQSDVVVAVVAEDLVGALAADDHVVAGIAADQVGRAAVGGRRVDRRPAERVQVVRADGEVDRQQPRVDARQVVGVHEAAVAELGDADHGAVVAEDQVVPVAAGDRVASGAAEDDVVARIAVDDVVAAGVLGAHVEVRVHARRHDVGQLDARVGRRQPVADVALVAEDQVVALVAEDRVAALAAEDPVGRQVAGDHVGGAVLRVGRPRLNVAQRRQEAHVERRRDQVGPQVRDVLGDHAVVAEDDVLVGRVRAGAGVDVQRRRGVAEHEADAREVAVERVPAGGEVVAGRQARAGGRRDREVAAEHVDVDTRITVDLVDPAAADDQVVARAARQEVAGLAAVEHVVTGAAVRGDADRDPLRAGARGAELHRRQERERAARVDHVVPEDGEREGGREVEEVVGRADLVERLLVAAGCIRAQRQQVVEPRRDRLGRAARVPRAVLRRVAVEHER